MMHRNQHQHRNLEVFTVKPGPETGLYYILVANLAHRTTWRELKSFASQACEVDHAEVYPPTSGFVRVRGRANFEKAFRYLDGNTLEYRALQADGRNLNQDTVVKLLLTDYHAVRIMRGDNARVVAEPGDPSTEPLEVLSQGLGGITLAGGAYLDYQGNPSPGLSLGDLQWRYPTGPPYGGRGYQPAPAPAPSPALRPPGPLAYPTVAVPGHGFVPQPVLGAPPAMYQGGATNSSTSTSPQTAIVPYPYGESATYYPPGAVYDGRAPSYTGFVPPPPHPALPGKNSGPYTNPTYDYSSDALTPIQPDNVPSIVNSRAASMFEPRKILIRDLEREGLSEPVVTGLLIQHTGIGNAPGQVEKVEIPLNRDGRTRGTAYVTFSTADLASTAAAGVNGLRVGSREVSARVVENGGSREGLAEGGRSRSGQRVGGASSGKANRGGGGSGNSKSTSGKVSRSGQPAQAMGSVIVSSGGLGSDSSLKSPIVNDPVSGTTAATASMYVSGSMSSLVEGSSQNQKKEDRPVIVDGSSGRWKKESAPVVVDGSGGLGSQGGNGGGNRKTAGGGNRGARF